MEKTSETVTKLKIYFVFLATIFWGDLNHLFQAISFLGENYWLDWTEVIRQFCSPLVAFSSGGSWCGLGLFQVFPWKTWNNEKLKRGRKKKSGLEAKSKRIDTMELLGASMSLCSLPFLFWQSGLCPDLLAAASMQAGGQSIDCETQNGYFGWVYDQETAHL